MVFFIGLFAAIIALVFLYVLKLNYHALGVQLAKSFSSPIGWLWLLVILLCLAATIYITAQAQYSRFSSVTKISFASCLEYTFTTRFLNMISTCYILDGAYSIYWMKKHRLSNSQSFAFSLYNILINETAQCILFMPAYIYLLTRYHDVVSVQHGAIIFWIMSAELLINVATIFLYFFMGYSRRFAFRAS
jgi:hypothetical protein